VALYYYIVLSVILYFEGLLCHVSAWNAYIYNLTTFKVHGSLSKLIIHYLRSIGFPDGIQPFGSRHYIQRLCQTHYNNYMAKCAKKESTSVSSIQISIQNTNNLPSSTTLTYPVIRTTSTANLEFKTLGETTVKYMKNKKPTRCHLLFYCTSYRLIMFRALLCPSSGTRDYDVDYHIGRSVLVLLYVGG